MKEALEEAVAQNEANIKKIEEAEERERKKLEASRQIAGIGRERNEEAEKRAQELQKMKEDAESIRKH